MAAIKLDMYQSEISAARFQLSVLNSMRFTYKSDIISGAKPTLAVKDIIKTPLGTMQIVSIDKYMDLSNVVLNPYLTDFQLKLIKKKHAILVITCRPMDTSELSNIAETSDSISFCKNNAF